MKVILEQDIDTLGRRGDVINVADGYARNYLMPRSLAVYASVGNLKTLETMKASIEKERAHHKGEAEKLAEKLGGLPLTITVKTGEKDRLYGSVTTKDVAEAIEKASIEIDSENPLKINRKKLMVKGDIKALGKHEVMIDLYPEVQAKLAVNVVAEKKAEPKKKAPAREAAKKTKEEKETTDKKEIKAELEQETQPEKEKESGT